MVTKDLLDKDLLDISDSYNKRTDVRDYSSLTDSIVLNDPAGYVAQRWQPPVEHTKDKSNHQEDIIFIVIETPAVALQLQYRRKN